VTTLDYALAYLQAGYSVIPIKPDGSKAPDLRSWEEFQHRKATVAELEKWFGSKSRSGIGLVCGTISRNLEVLDFDDAETFAAFVRKVGEAQIAALPRVRTPKNGTHLYLHRTAPPAGNRKLAQRSVTENGKRKVQCLIETRGEGGQVVAPGTPAHCHPLNKLYVWITPPVGVAL
jgi:Bifunctional DNA primase/polymerase, N-terminal